MHVHTHKAHTKTPTSWHACAHTAGKCWCVCALQVSCTWGECILTLPLEGLGQLSACYKVDQEVPRLYKDLRVPHNPLPRPKIGSGHVCFQWPPKATRLQFTQIHEWVDQARGSLSKKRVEPSLSDSKVPTLVRPHFRDHLWDYHTVGALSV